MRAPLRLINRGLQHFSNFGEDKNPLEDESFYQGNQNYYLEDDTDYLG